MTSKEFVEIVKNLSVDEKVAVIDALFEMDEVKNEVSKTIKDTVAISETSSTQSIDKNAG